MTHVNGAKFLVAVLILCIAATSAAFACKLNSSASFQDDFKKPDPEWRPDGKTLYFADGQLVIKPDANQTSWIAIPTFAFKNATYCVDVKLPPDTTELDEAGGLIFWLVNNHDFYLVIIHPDGNYEVDRAGAGFEAAVKWISIIPTRKFEKLKTAPGAVNEIKVTALNNLVTVFFNGEKAIDFRAQAPKRGGEVGLIAQSSTDKPNEWRFLDIVVNEDLDRPPVPSRRSALYQ